MASGKAKRRNPMMVNSGSRIMLDDSLSRDASDGSNSDTYPQGMIWKHVRIHGTSVRGESIDREEAVRRTGVIGRWYADCEYDDRRQVAPKNAVGGHIPWGAIFPVRIDMNDIDELGNESIKKWTERRRSTSSEGAAGRTSFTGFRGALEVSVGVRTQAT